MPIGPGECVVYAHKWIIIGVCLMCLNVKGESLSIAPMFTDHMVVQRQMPVTIWGQAPAGSDVHVRLAKREAATRADENGRWKVSLESLQAGGPHELLVEAGGEQLLLKDILVGEVWIGSGQSNMEWSLDSITNAEAEVASADYPHIRLFNVPTKASAQPLEDVQGGPWNPCTPEHARPFSAVLYFFGRNLHKELGVPVGLINSSVGGTRIQSWMSAEAVTPIPGCEWELRGFDNYEEVRAAYLPAISEWRRLLDEADRGLKEGWADPDMDDSDWREMPTIGGWNEQPGMETFTGTVWHRLTLDLPSEWEGHDLTLMTGTIHNYDEVYVNGRKVAGTGVEADEPERINRWYVIPADAWSSSGCVICLRVTNIGEKGGIGVGDQWGAVPMLFPNDYPEQAHFTMSDLAWRYRVGADAATVKGLQELPEAPRDLTATRNATVLYNAMIHPLIPYGIRGVIWYQGEANTHEADRYEKLFPALIDSWRKAWGQGVFPFYFVQLSNYMDRREKPADSNWAALRDAQRKTLSVENTAMAVTIDIGEEQDIHPKNKQDVGLRLALPALNRIYDRGRVDSGPVFEAIRTGAGTVRLTFDVRGSELAAPTGHLKAFAVAGRDRIFYWADARIEGDRAVVLSCDEVKDPVAVRYAWADSPGPDLLYNKAGLPALPFRTDDW